MNCHNEEIAVSLAPLGGSRHRPCSAHRFRVYYLLHCYYLSG